MDNGKEEGQGGVEEQKKQVEEEEQQQKTEAGNSRDRISIKLILVSGRTHEFNQFTPSTSAAEICQRVFENWPPEWEEERVSSASMLKLIYHGRFLHGSVALGALNLPAGASTVMHLVTRETLPEPNSNENLKKSKSRSCFCCCIC